MCTTILAVMWALARALVALNYRILLPPDHSDGFPTVQTLELWLCVAHV